MSPKAHSVGVHYLAPCSGVTPPQGCRLLKPGAAPADVVELAFFPD